MICIKICILHEDRPNGSSPKRRSETEEAETWKKSTHNETKNERKKWKRRAHQAQFKWTRNAAPQLRLNDENKTSKEATKKKHNEIIANQRWSNAVRPSIRMHESTCAKSTAKGQHRHSVCLSTRDASLWLWYTLTQRIEVQWSTIDEPYIFGNKHTDEPFCSKMMRRRRLGDSARERRPAATMLR